jgi:hypothetical protein
VRASSLGFKTTEAVLALSAPPALLGDDAILWDKGDGVES